MAKFRRMDGSEGAGASFDAAIVYLGPDVAGFVRVFGELGAVYRRVGGGKAA